MCCFGVCRLGEFDTSVEELAAGGIVRVLLAGDANEAAVVTPAATAASSAPSSTPLASTSEASFGSALISTTVIPPMILPVSVVVPYCPLTVATDGSSASANSTSLPTPGALPTPHRVHVVPAQPSEPSCAYKFHSAGREDVDVRMLGNGEC